MKFNNKGNAFEVTFDGNTYNIPQGKFEVNNDKLSSYLNMEVVGKWEVSLEKIGDSEQTPTVSTITIEPEKKTKKDVDESASTITK